MQGNTEKNWKNEIVTKRSWQDLKKKTFIRPRNEFAVKNHIIAFKIPLRYYTPKMPLLDTTQTVIREMSSIRTRTIVRILYF